MRIHPGTAGLPTMAFAYPSHQALHDLYIPFIDPLRGCLIFIPSAPVFDGPALGFSEDKIDAESQQAPPAVTVLSADAAAG